MQDQSITLSDGRTLGFQCLGEPDDRPVFFFHGTPGSRLELSEDDLLAQIPGIRLILPDRPGYGISDPKPGRVLLDWPADVAELADHLGIESFVVGGASGGGPHALACAHRLAHRVTMVLLFSSPVPATFKGATRGMALGNRLAISLGRYAPWVVRWMHRINLAAFKKNPESFVAAVAKQLPPPDRALLEKASVREAFVRDFREAYRQGSEGHAVDGTLTMTSRDWGFDLRDISVPVFSWHGEEDTLVPKSMAEHLARELPRCEARIVPAAGHLVADEPKVIEQVRAVLCEEGSSPLPG